MAKKAGSAIWRFGMRSAMGLLVFWGCLEGGYQPAGESGGSELKSWIRVQKGNFELSIPQGADLYADKSGIELEYRGAYGGIEIVEPGNDFIEAVIGECDPRQELSRGDLTLYACSERSKHRYLLMQQKAGNARRIVSYIQADTPAMIKTLALSIVSLRRATAKGTPAERGATKEFAPMRSWAPRDGSFTVQVPQGWKVSGGTADLGRNGYLRIVWVESPDGKRGFIGLYYPSYQFIRMGGIQSGSAPLDGRSYLNGPLFALLGNYGIYFNNLQLQQVGVDPEASKQATMEVENLLRQHRFNGSMRFEAVWGKGSFEKLGEAMKLLLFGKMEYVQMPQAYGAATTLWGPAPLYLTYAPEREMAKAFGLLEAIAQSWQVNPRWLGSHLNYARQDARQTIQHFRNISKIIRQHEHSLDQALDQHDAQNRFEDEIFWDTFYALGGEERYEHPETGEEIDLPTGADKYLYDQYSQSWVGISEDQPDAQEWMQHLKERGWVELKPHRW